MSFFSARTDTCRKSVIQACRLSASKTSLVRKATINTPHLLGYLPATAAKPRAEGGTRKHGCRLLRASTAWSSTRQASKQKNMLIRTAHQRKAHHIDESNAFCNPKPTNTICHHHTPSYATSQIWSARQCQPQQV